MSHARTSIRQAFVNVLKNNTDAGDKVYDSNLYTLGESSLPAIIVFSSNEEVQTSTISYPRSQDRILKVNVECYVKSTVNANIIVDNIAASIEQIIVKDQNLKKLCHDLKLASTDITLNNDGDQPVAVANLTFIVTYRTKEDNPGTPM